VAGGPRSRSLPWLAGWLAEGPAWAQISGVSTPRPNLNGNVERPLRNARGGDVVIEAASSSSIARCMAAIRRFGVEGAAADGRAIVPSWSGHSAVSAESAGVRDGDIEVRFRTQAALS
jgi:hypothetical protein